MRKKSVGLTNDNGKSNASTAYQRGSNRDGSPHYVFLYSDDDDDNDDDDNGNDKNIPLQLQNHKLRKDICPRKVEVVSVTLKPEDTLQALSLTYRCTISEIKRINNIHKENEIFARRVIKVPVPPFSILTEIRTNISEQEPQQREIEVESVNETVGIIDINNSIEPQKETVIFPSTSNSYQNHNIDNNSNNDDINRIILNSMSIDRSKNNLTNDNLEIDHSENDELLVDERDRDSTPEARVVELFGCSGADWGLTWIHLLGASLMLGFVLPIIYYLFLTENHQHIQSRNSTRT